MTRYWIRLYHELLYDSKVAVLPDRLWRRMIELFLIAGEVGGSEPDGSLPPIDRIAWILHSKPEEVEKEIEFLSTIGVTERGEDGTWRVKNFAKRQAPATSAERQRARRSKNGASIAIVKKSQNVTKRDILCHENVTQNVQDNKITDNRLIKDVVVVVDGDANEKNLPNRNELYAVYEKEIGPLTPAIVARIDAASERYPSEWIVQAITTAAVNNARSWRYVDAVLRNWQENGFQSKPAKPQVKRSSVHDNNRQVVQSILGEEDK